MNSKDILEVLDCIKAEPSLNLKIELIKDFSYDSEFMRVLELAYNPLKTFKMLVLPDVTPGLYNFSKLTYLTLEELASGELSGNIAKANVKLLLGGLNAPSQELFKRILNKDLRADFGAKLINKAVKGFIKLEPYMRCSLPKHVNMDELRYPLLSQLKMDGSYMTVTNASTVRLATRKGQEFPETTFENLRAFGANRVPQGFQTQGEILFERNGELLGRSESNGLVVTALKLGEMPEDATPCYYIWDMVSIQDIQEGSKEAYLERFDKISKDIVDWSFGVFEVDSRFVYNLEEAVAHFDEVVAKKLEGTILKSFDGMWKNGTSKDQIKLKDTATCELRVTGYTPGKGKYSHLVGSLECESGCGKLSTFISGFTDEMREHITANFESKIKGSIVEAKHNGVTKSKVKERWALCHGQFVEFRFDKDEADELCDIDPKGGFEPTVKSVGEDFYEV